MGLAVVVLLEDYEGLVMVLQYAVAAAIVVVLLKAEECLVLGLAKPSLQEEVEPLPKTSY